MGIEDDTQILIPENTTVSLGLLQILVNRDSLAEWDVSDLTTEFLQSSDENYGYPPRELFVTSHCFYPKINHFDYFHIQGPHIFASTMLDFH
jgi:hypothetical protein